ncbi:MAG: AMP-binding protein, partial [Pseudonocardiaceae bacterium]|nr:AMP-binding protein [Pseudonocardiaceae bacterium]
MTPTLVARLLEHARERAGEVALREKFRGVWREWTWAEYARWVADVAAGLRALGVGPGCRVAIHAENRPEWVVADLAAQGLGACSVGVYPTSPAVEVEYVLAHSEAEVLIAEDEEQLDKALAVRSRLPLLRHIVVMDPRGVPEGLPEVRTFAELARGASDALDAYAASVAALDPAETAVLVYTSGTTGPPKGAMISHTNLVAAGETSVALGAVRGDQVL